MQCNHVTKSAWFEVSLHIIWGNMLNCGELDEEMRKLAQYTDRNQVETATPDPLLLKFTNEHIFLD